MSLQHTVSLLLALILLLLASPKQAYSQAQAEVPSLSPVETPPAQVWRLYYATLAEHRYLATKLNVVALDEEEQYLAATLSDEQVQSLQADGYRLRFDFARTSQLGPDAGIYQSTVSGGVPFYPCYRTVEESYTTLAQLATDNPGLARLIDIGDSWEKINLPSQPGYDIHALVVTNLARPGPKFKFVLLGAVHAREMTTAETALRFAELLIQNYGIDPDVTWLLDYGELHVIPIANPDGRKRAEQGFYWRKNANSSLGCFNHTYGVDLNRNSSFKWNECENGSSCSSSDVCSDTYRGPAPASEPETQAIEEYVRTLFPSMQPSAGQPAPADTAGLFISLHSYYPKVLFPWGWTAQAAPNQQALQTLGRKFGFITGYPVCQSGAPGCIYATDGTTDDWVYGEFGVAAYTIEIGYAFFESCTTFEQQLLDPMLQALLYAFKAAQAPYLTPASPEVLQVELSQPTVLPGTPVTLTAIADATRYFSGGYGLEPVEPIQALRLSLNAPTWHAPPLLIDVMPQDGTFDSKVEPVVAVVDTKDLPVGRHTLFVEAQDASGSWGIPTTAFLNIATELVDLAVDSTPLRLHAVPGATIASTVTITNTGYSTGTFQITIKNGPDWPIQYASSPFTLAGAEARRFPLSITIPTSAPTGQMETLILHVASISAPEVEAELIIQVNVESNRLFLPRIAMPEPNQLLFPIVVP
jgi:carboxypeptidase T